MDTPSSHKNYNKAAPQDKAGPNDDELQDDEQSVSEFQAPNESGKLHLNDLIEKQL